MKRKSLFYLIVVILFSSQTLKAQLEASSLVITDGIRNEKLKQTIEKNVSDFLVACNTAVIKGGKPDLDKKTTTEDARKRFLSLWNTSPMGCSVSTFERKCLTRPAGGYQIRNVSVTMYEAPENEQNQEIVFNLTADGKIDDIFIPITQYSDLLSANIKAEDISLRMMVLDFVENYRTAYNRKDIAFIESVFSNNAIIIVGKEIKQKPKSDAALRSSLSTAQFEYQVKNKTQYITALKNVFKVNKYIKVKFDEIKVLQHEDYPQVYGITLKQLWDSSTLKDETGYVFLLIDFRDEQQPLIHVRTWQPEEYDGRTLRRDELFQIGDFNLNRF
jgi:hypothetical protein